MSSASERGCVVGFLAGLVGVSCYLSGKIVYTVYLAAYSNSQKMDEVTRYVLYCTALSSISFTIGLCLAFVSEIIRCSILGWSNDSAGWDEVSRSYNKVADWRGSWYTIHVVGYCLILSVIVERLRLVFSSTIVELNQRNMTAMRTALVTATVLAWCWVATQFYFRRPLIALVFSSVSGINYGALCTYVSWKFLDNTRNLVINNETKSVTHDLLNVAIRLGLVCLAALLSTALLNVGLIVQAVRPSVTGAIMSDLTTCMDACFNSFFLLLTFKQSLSTYQLWFGRIHQYCLNSLLENEQIKGSV